MKFIEKMSSPGISTDISTMLSNPTKAVRNMVMPLVMSMLLVSVYNLVDAIWISGLGADALAGVGFTTPIFLVLAGIGNGLGTAATSVISRYLGENNKEKADNATVHTIIIAVILSVTVSVLLLSLQDFMLTSMGAGYTISYAEEYGTIMFTGAILFILPNVVYGILRAEGAVVRTMYAMVISGLLNIVLDPIFIYVFSLGVAGAAYSTLLSVLIVLVILIYWFYIKKDTCLKPFWSNYKYDRKITRDILGIGIPASLEMLLTALFIALFSALLTNVADTDAVAVYTTGWRVVSLGSTPIYAISTSLVPIVGANLGAKNYENIKLVHRYTIELTVIVAVITSLIIFIFAPQIIMLFTHSISSSALAPRMISFLRCMVSFFVFMAIGTPSTLLFQGLGKGITAMFQTFLRQLLLTLLFAYMHAVIFELGEYGAWWGIVVGEFFACIITYTWAKGYIKHLFKENKISSVISIWLIK